MYTHTHTHTYILSPWAIDLHGVSPCPLFTYSIVT